MDKSLAPFHRNRVRLPRQQRQHERSSKANRQLVEMNPPSSSGGIDLRIPSRDTFTRNGKPDHSLGTYPNILPVSSVRGASVSTEVPLTDDVGETFGYVPRIPGQPTHD
ncbi:unnamed protein product [Protopolystoma xenopodis]|uniref:Uncharacterized protein n=1 Tax=Protopolystoma xenopodis TaxID=117903 RepID=A0A3S5AFZ5_9PLAT|nr:unnamed protein product [Protopolystoma xenopodis]